MIIVMIILIITITMIIIIIKITIKFYTLEFLVNYVNRRLTISRANCFWKLSKRWIKIDYPFLWKKCYQTSDLPIIQPISYCLGNSKNRDSSLFDQTEKDCFSATELMYVKAPVLNPCKRISLAIKTRFERVEACFIRTVDTLHV